MPKQLNFYVDDSGSRHPDRPRAAGRRDRDWFALGGVVIDEADEGEFRRRYAEFCDQWEITYPLHSSDIRYAAEKFRWIRTAGDKEKTRFFTSLTNFLIQAPAIGLACVIDRPGYNKRYAPRYRENRWMLCKTAFTILVERAAKYAQLKQRRLNLYVEACSRTDDGKIREYFKTLKAEGPPFYPNTSAKYFPLGDGELRGILYDLKFKQKTSPGVQVADLYLWPMCMGGYHASNRAYVALKEAGKLMDVLCDPARVDELGIKYSCFEGVQRRP